MKKTIIVSLCVLAFTSITWAQEMKNGKEVLVPSNLKQEIGLAAGFSTGYGLSYRYWPSKLGVQVTCSPFVSTNTTDISFGATGLLDLRSYNRYRFFLYLANSYHYNEQNEEYFVYDYNNNMYNTTTSTVTTIEKAYTIGFGPGMEFLLGERVGLNLMFGYMGRVDENKDWSVSPTVETGLYFRF